MVKPPKIRHSKAKSDPVTIDLTPTKVAGASAASEATSRPELKSDPSATKPVEASPTGSLDTKPAPLPQMQPSPASAASSAAASSHGFGRQDPPQASKPATAAPPPPKADAPKPQPEPVRTAPRQNPDPAPKSRGGVSAIAAGVIGGLVAVGVGYGLQAAGILPSPQSSEIVSAPDSGPPLAALESEIAALREQVAALPAPAADSGVAVGDLTARVDQIAAAVEAIRAAPPSTSGAPDGAALAALSDKVGALEAAAAQPAAALEAANAKIATLEQTLAAQAGSVASGAEAMAGMTSRLTAMEERVGALGESVEGQPRMALAIASTALKAAVDRGGTFSTELDTYAAVAPDPTALEPLRAYAVEGVATRIQIEGEASAAAVAMIDAARPVDPNVGLVGRLMNSAQSLVSVRPVGSVEGEGAPAIVARMEAAVMAGDYPGAVAEYETLPEPAKAAGAAFVARLKARHEADSLVEAALAGALKPAPAPASGG